ncbi:39990_t:CDS:1, partial [Gigaspora margarita]
RVRPGPLCQIVANSWDLMLSISFTTRLVYCTGLLPNIDEMLLFARAR